MMNIVRHVTLGALLAVLFVPLVIVNEFFFPFITGKALLFRVLVEIAVAGWFVLALADVRYRPRFSWIMAVLTGFVIWMLIADLSAINPGKALWSNFERMEGFVALAHLYVFFVVLGAFSEAERQWRLFWLVSLGVAALVTGYALAQLAGVFVINQGGVRVDATFGNATYLAAYLLFHFFIAGWRAMEERGWFRYALYALMPLMAFVLFNTATRGAILGLVLGMSVVAFMLVISGGRTYRRAGGVALAAVVLVAAGFFAVKDSAWVRENPILTRIASISVADGATRFTIWRIAGEGFLERPILGWGQEGFNYVFNTHYDPSLYEQEQWFDRAHNAFIDWLIAGGAPAFLLYLVLFALALAAVLKRTEHPAEQAMIAGLLAAYGFHSLFVFDNLVSSFLFMAVLAYLHARHSRVLPFLERLPRVSPATLRTIAFPATCAVVLMAIWVINAPPAQVASGLIRALGGTGSPDERMAHFEQALARGFATQEVREQLVQFSLVLSAAPGVSEELRAHVIRRATDEMSREIEAAPQDTRLALMRSLTYRAAGNFPAAATELARARSLSPNKQSLILDQGVTALAVGDTAAAKVFFEEAYDLDRRFDNTAAYAALGSILAGDVAEGKSLLRGHFNTEHPGNDVVMFAYRQAGLYDDFIACWKARVTVENGSPSSRFGLAAAYAIAGRMAAAREEVRAIVKDHPNMASDAAEFLSSLSAEAPL